MLFRKRSRLQCQNKEITPNKSVALWEDTGRIFYLLSTLKITYQNQLGLITIENIRSDRLVRTLEEIRREVRQTFGSEHNRTASPIIDVSVCGVSWQQYNNASRVKAVNDAARLRLNAENICQTCAEFRYELKESTEEKSIHHLRVGEHKYFDVTPEQFLNKLNQQNSSLPQKFKKKLHVKADNFVALFSSSEVSTINGVAWRL
ncbi:MAG: hypothetical protein AAGJ37_04900 [Pseudomonadota bacterium]